MSTELEQDFVTIAREVLSEIGHENMTIGALEAAEKQLRLAVQGMKLTGGTIYRDIVERYSIFFGECLAELLGGTHYIYTDEEEELSVCIDPEAGIYLEPIEMVERYIAYEDFSVVSLFHYIKVSMNKDRYLSSFPDLDFTNYVPKEMTAVEEVA